MASQPQQNHLLSLKVLRLSKPSFHHRSEIKAVEFLLKDAREEEEFQSDLGVGDFLALPPAFGNIYLGETFTAYLCVNNDSNTSVSEVAFKAELQTTSQRFTLADTIGTTPTNSVDGLNQQKKSAITPMDQVSLLPRQSAEFILHHEIKELGIHILVCSVHYTPQTSSTLPQDRQRKFFRKFFKFQVLNPLSVKTKVNNIQGGKISLEIQIQNLAGLPFCLDKVGFEANELFNSMDLNDGVDFKTKTISPQDSRQYLFILSPKRASDMSARVTPNLGRLDIFWKSTMGQAGIFAFNYRPPSNVAINQKSAVN
jgi:trafficking protein particle complex subunit 13